MTLGFGLFRNEMEMVGVCDGEGDSTCWLAVNLEEIEKNENIMLERLINDMT